jgi:tRNA(His) guanylyltransferase
VKPDEMEARMRELEWFHSLRAFPGAWIVIRVDGRGFSKLTESAFEKPFDSHFHTLMTQTAEALLLELHGVYAYTESDEISILLPRDSDLFSRELEKLVSISAAVASATFTHAAGRIAHFDSRMWLGITQANVLDYFRWRQTDAARCCLHGWCYCTLRKEGQSVAEATALLRGKSFSELNELLFQRGRNFNDLPVWQRRGTGIYWEQFEKQGTNPISGAVATAVRRRVKVDESIPKAEEYDVFIRSLMDAE